ncbi:uncharacterized protein LOC119462456 isoform X2 [Dermacentor silvarum]|uniref:uncharacterized protein LOC119462456 isoform X2 n=1 Tax=Dermacentor silvarum TaxID=543639 RepID=UPI0021006B01|nr:uncharacterized protein LOC119462456 isoform X2 [Dermacentor silvarum]
MKKRKVRKPFRYCDDDDDSFEVPQPPENFPATMKTTESAADIPGQGDDTNESTRNTEAVNQQSPLKPSNLVSLEDTKLQQKPPVSKLLSPAVRILRVLHGPGPEDQEWAVQRASAIAEDLERFFSGDGPLVA